MRSSRMMAGLVALLAACGRAAPPRDTLAYEAPWLVMFGDTAFAIALDTANVERRPDATLIVRFQTRRVEPLALGADFWTRSTLQMRIGCGPLRFQRGSETLSLGDGPPILESRVDLAALPDSLWREPSATSRNGRLLALACERLRA